MTRVRMTAGELRRVYGWAVEAAEGLPPDAPGWLVTDAKGNVTWERQEVFGSIEDLL